LNRVIRIEKSTPGLTASPRFHRPFRELRVHDRCFTIRVSPPRTAPAPPAPDGEERDLEEWPAATDDDPALLREEDAGQTVPR